MTTTKMIKIKSSDGVEIELPLDVAIHSEFIKNAMALEDNDDDAMDETTSEVIVCERVSSLTLQSIVVYLKYYAETRMQDIPEPTESKNNETFEGLVPQEWYRNYVKELGLDMVWRVRSAAHFMLIEPLTTLMNLWIAFELMGKSTEEVNRILRIPEALKKEKEETDADTDATEPAVPAPVEA